MDILRVIDRRWEENLFYIRLDNEIEENWLMNVYLLDGKTDKPVIIVEDKTNPEKSISYEYKASEIFKFSDTLVDSLTDLLDREIKKRKVD